MKKIYIKPDIELKEVELLFDVLGPSLDEPEDESVVPGGGSGWDDGGGMEDV